MSIPLIDPLPPAPTPADPEPVFDEKAYETVAALAPFVEQTNALALAVEAEAARSENEADRSQAQVNVATTEANRAQTEAERAKDEADRAEQARDDAVVVVTDGQGSLTPAPGKFPVAGADASIKQAWVSDLEFELDALRVAKNKMLYGDGPYPVLDLQFQGAKYLDPRITFSRASLDWDEEGNEYGIDEPVLTDQGLWVSGARTNLWPYAVNLSTSTPQTSNQGNLENAVGDGRFTKGVMLTGGINELTLFYTYTPSLDLSKTYTFTAYVSVGDGGKPNIGSVANDAGLDAVFVGFNSFDSSALNLKSSLSHYKGDIWRYSATFSRPDATSSSVGFLRYPTNSQRPLTVWAIQLELGDVGTPLIPTNGSQVTVAASTLEVKGDAFASVFNPTAGTLMLATGENNIVHAGSIPPFVNFGILGRETVDITGGFSVLISSYSLWNPGGDRALPSKSLPKPINNNPNFSLAMAYDSSSLMIGVDGMTNSAEVDTTVFMQNEASRIYLSPRLNGYAKSITYYDKKLTEEQLQELAL